MDHINNEGEYRQHVGNLFEYNSPALDVERIFRYIEYDVSRGQCLFSANQELFPMEPLPPQQSSRPLPRPLEQYPAQRQGESDDSSDSDEDRPHKASRVRRRLFVEENQTSSDEGIEEYISDDQPLDYEYWYPAEVERMQAVYEVQVMKPLQPVKTMRKRSKTKCAYKAVRRFFKSIGWGSKSVTLRKAIDTANRPAFLLQCPKCLRPMRVRTNRTTNGFCHKFLGLKRHVFRHLKENDK